MPIPTKSFLGWRLLESEGAADAAAGTNTTATATVANTNSTAPATTNSTTASTNSENKATDSTNAQASTASGTGTTGDSTSGAATGGQAAGSNECVLLTAIAGGKRTAAQNETLSNYEAVSNSNAFKTLKIELPAPTSCTNPSVPGTAAPTEAPKSDITQVAGTMDLFGSKVPILFLAIAGGIMFLMGVFLLLCGKQNQAHKKQIRRLSAVVPDNDEDENADQDNSEPSPKNKKEKKKKGGKEPKDKGGSKEKPEKAAKGGKKDKKAAAKKEEAEDDGGDFREELDEWLRDGIIDKEEYDAMLKEHIIVTRAAAKHKAITETIRKSKADGHSKDKTRAHARNSLTDHGHYEEHGGGNGKNKSPKPSPKAGKKGSKEIGPPADSSSSDSD